MSTSLSAEQAAAKEALATARVREESLLASLSRAEASLVASRGLDDSLARLSADLRVRDAAVAAAQADFVSREAQMAALQSLLETVTQQRADEVAALSTQLADALAARDASLAAAAAAKAGGATPAHLTTTQSLQPEAGSDFGVARVGDPASSRALDASHVRIATLQSRVHELRAALADAQARALDGDSHSVDRRVVAQLFVQFVRLQRASGRWGGHASKRSRDALVVLARMLGLSGRDSEAVGCDDEVVGPAELGGDVASSVAGLFGSFWRAGAASAAQAKPPSSGEASADTGDSESPGASSLGAAFVHFLLEETAAASAANETPGELAEVTSAHNTAQQDPLVPPTVA